MGNSLSRHAFLAVTRGHIARPVANVLFVAAILHTHENHGMTALPTAHILVPEDFHKIARLRPGEISKVPAKIEFVEQAGCARAICIPTAPDSFAIALIPNDEMIQGRVVELKQALLAQRFNRSNKNQIGRAGAETGRGLRRKKEKFPGLKMGGRLKSYLRDARNRIASAPRHLFDLIENDGVTIPGQTCPDRKTGQENNP